jgi:hypothetical protein
MFPPEFTRPIFSTDQAHAYFHEIPPVEVMAGVMLVDEEEARFLRAIATRMPRGQAVAWLNDVAEALYRGYPLNPVMIAAISVANHGTIWKRKVNPHAT